MGFQFFNMKGAWGKWYSTIYEIVVASGIDPLHDAVASSFFSNLQPGTRLLDLGCGSGQVSIRIARLNPDSEIVGIDLSQSMVERGRKRGSDLKNLSFEVDDAMNLSLPDESFDIVLSVASIKHWPDPLAGVKEMRRVCKKNGQIFVVEADPGCTTEDAKRFVSGWRYVTPGTRPLLRWYFQRFVAGQGFSAEKLTDILSDSGLEKVKMQKIPEQPLVMATGIK